MRWMLLGVWLAVGSASAEARATEAASSRFEQIVELAAARKMAPVDDTQLRHMKEWCRNPPTLAQLIRTHPEKDVMDALQSLSWKRNELKPPEAPRSIRFVDLVKDRCQPPRKSYGYGVRLLELTYPSEKDAARNEKTLSELRQALDTSDFKRVHHVWREQEHIYVALSTAFAYWDEFRSLMRAVGAGKDLWLSSP